MNSYFYTNGSEKFGPFTLEDLKKENLTKDTLVWFEGLKTWEKASDIEELSPLFKITPPPIPVIASPPPIPKTEIHDSTFPSLEKEQKSSFNYKPFLIGAIIIGLIIFGLERFINHKTEEAKNVAVVQAQQFATQAVQENENQKQEEILRQQQIQEEQARIAIENEKVQIRNNITSYIKVDGSYSYRRIGGISDVIVYVLNNTQYKVDVAKVQVTYIKADGGAWKTEFVEVNNIEPFSKKSVYAPNSDRGTKINTNLFEVSSAEIGI